MTKEELDKHIDKTMFDRYHVMSHRDPYVDRVTFKLPHGCMGILARYFQDSSVRGSVRTGIFWISPQNEIIGEYITTHLNEVCVTQWFEDVYAPWKDEQLKKRTGADEDTLGILDI